MIESTREPPALAVTERPSHLARLLRWLTGRASDPGPSPSIELNRAKSDSDQAERLTVIRSLRDGAQDKVAQLDHLRMRNLTIALAVFAGLFSFAFPFEDLLRSLLTAAAQTLVMIAFAERDRALHQSSEGWQLTQSRTTDALAKAYNHPDDKVEFPKYANDATRATRTAFYWALITTGPVAFVLMTVLPALFG